MDKLNIAYSKDSENNNRLRLKPTKDIFDLRSETILKKDFVFQPQNYEKYRSGLLIIGANSFVGIHLLHEVIDKWNGPIYCMVRANSLEHGVDRIIESSNRWGLAPIDDSSVNILIGDIKEPNWNLSPQEYQEIVEHVGTVVHMALKARYNLPYRFYQRDWVPNLENIIEFCANPDYPKRLHYPGSFNSHFFNNDEDFKRQDSCAWFSGYSGFKWIAENVLRKAFSGNLQGCVYDIPLVFGSLTEKKCPEQYSIWPIVDLFIKSGKVFDFNFSIVGVDYLVKIICANMINEVKGNGAKYIRPVFKESISQKHLIEALQPQYNLIESTSDEIVKYSDNSRIAAFLIPPDMSEIIHKAHRVSQILPVGFEESILPDGVQVFTQNLFEYLKNKNK